MAVRSDIEVDFLSSPRRITVGAPSTELTIQDLVDTLRSIEDDPSNMSFGHLIDAAGKEALGGGTKVGITATLRDARVAFQARLTPAQEGSVTTADPNGITLTDSTATFSTNGIQRGATVINKTDGSLGEVKTVDSETQLTLEARLSGGTENDFDLDDGYEVLNVVQCNVSGGNLTAVDSAGNDIDPVSSTPFTQVVRTASSSATLQELRTLQHSSFEGGVWIDVSNKTGNAKPGTVFPSGTPLQPVDNLTDAKSIAEERGFGVFFVLGNLTIDSGNTFTGFRFVGESPKLSRLTLESAATITECEFVNATVDGFLDRSSIIRDCIVESLNFIEGQIINCLLSGIGTIVLGGTTSVNILDCWDASPSLSTPVIDYGGSGRDLNVRNYAGGLEIRNKNGPDAVAVGLAGGRLILDSTVQDGEILVRGDGRLVDNSTGTTNVINELTTEFAERAEQVMRNRLVTDPETGKLTIYANDGTTVLFTANLYKDTVQTPWDGGASPIQERTRLT